MIRSKFLLLIIFFSFLTNNVKSESTIYFFDLEYIFNNSNYGKIIIKDLENLNNVISEDLNIEQEKIKKLEEEIVKTKNLLSDEDLNKKILNLRKLIESYNIKKKKVFDEFNLNKKNKLEEFSNKINPIVQNYVLSNDITILLNRKNIFIGKNDYDITFKILEIVNKKINE